MVRSLTDGPGVTSRAPVAVSAGGGILAASPPDRHRTWRAVIEWRDTEDGPRFDVIARADDDGREVTIAHSDPLNWPPKRPESVQALTDAAEALEATLLVAGWRPLPPGSAWYAKRFIAEPSAASAPSDEVAPWPPTPHAARDRIPEGHSGTVPEAGDRPAMRRTVLVATVGQLVLAAAVIGVLLGRAFVAGDGAPAARPAPLTIAHGGLHVQLPSGWARGRAATVPGFSRPLSLKNARERLTALVERLPASSASLLPVAFETARPTAGERREVVRLGPGQPAWRYRVAHKSGSTIVLYAGPTSSGIATVACVVPTDAGVPSGCDKLAKAITVPGSVPLELGPNVAFYSRLGDAARELEAARSTGMHDLAAARSATGQAAAAEGLVRAHEHALAALAPLAGTRAGLPGETVRALNAMAGVYATLAGAARARSPQRYNAARRGVAGADAALRRTLAKAAAAATAASRAPTDARSRTQ
jgi:hypothetical protein